VVPTQCTAPTRFASEELARTLKAIVGSPFETIVDNGQVSGPAVFVGKSASAKRSFSEIDFSKLASEEIIINTNEPQLLLAGGGARGDI
jgi:hypothetical protein